jgi:hypothetical protein
MRLAPRVRTPRLLLPAAAICAAALAALVAQRSPGALLSALAYLLPALMLGLALARRRYPGERRLLALIGARPAPPRHRTATQTPTRGRPRAAMPRGGRLIAFSLAVRPPPALVASFD